MVMTTEQLQTLIQMHDAGFAKKYLQSYFKISPKKLNLILQEYESTNHGRV